MGGGGAAYHFDRSRRRGRIHRLEDDSMTIGREDLEAKAKEIQQAVSQTKEAMQNTAVLAGVAVVAFVAIAYWIGRRKGGKARIEVYRV
jgi:hypothetical protein